MELRAYTAGDAQATSVIFLRAVRETARAHYSPEQVEAWAADYGDLDSWAAARAAHTQLAIIDGQLAGFTDLDDTAISTCCSWIPISAGTGSRRRSSHRWSPSLDSAPYRH